MVLEEYPFTGAELSEPARGEVDGTGTGKSRIGVGITTMGNAGGSPNCIEGEAVFFATGFSLATGNSAVLMSVAC